MKQQFFSGSLIVPDNAFGNELQFFKGNFNSIETIGMIESEYLICIASDKIVSFKPSSKFLDNDFAENKILEFQQSSLRYRLCNFLLSPIKYLRKRG